MVRYACYIAIIYIYNFVVFYDLVAGRDYTTVSQEIIFSPGQSKVFAMIPLIGNTFRRPDVFFYVDIIFNTSIIAQSIVTIVDDDHGELYYWYNNQLYIVMIYFQRT